MKTTRQQIKYYKRKKQRGRRQTGMQNIHFECLSPAASEIIAEQENPEWLLLSLGTYVFLKKISIEVFFVCTTLENYDLGTRDKKLTTVFLFTPPTVFVLFKNVSALKNYSLIKTMCQRWPAICSQFAMQSRSYYNCYEFEAKVLHFSFMLMAVTFEFEEGLLKSGAQTLWNPWLSADYAVILVRFPHSPFSVFRSLFLVPPSSLSVLRSLLE